MDRIWYDVVEKTFSPVSLRVFNVICLPRT
jgi:hypothetical protein